MKKQKAIPYSSNLSIFFPVLLERQLRQLHLGRYYPHRVL